MLHSSLQFSPNSIVWKCHTGNILPESRLVELEYSWNDLEEARSAY